MNECSPPQVSMGCHVRNGEMESKRGRRFGHRAKRWMSPNGVCPSANLRERERDSWNRWEYKTVVWTKNYKKGFNKKWISTNLKVLGGENDLTHTVSQLLTDTQTVAPQSVPGMGQDTLPPLSGKDLTWPELGQPIHNHHSPLLTSSPFLSLLPLARFSVGLFPSWFLFFFFWVSRARRDTMEQRSLGRHCLWCHRCSRGSAEVLPLSKPAVPSFSYSVVLLSHFFKWHKRDLPLNVQDVFSRTWTGF